VACFEVLVARDTCKEGRCLVVHQRHFKAVVALLIGCAVLLLGVGCAVMRSQSPKEQGHTEAAKKEQTRSPEASSTARIACLRAEQGASSPPPHSTETLNGYSLTEVLTPKVAAHPDGVHIQFDNRLGKGAEYSARGSDVYMTLDSNVAWYVPIPKGKSNQAVLLPPGTGKISCSPRDVHFESNYASFQIVKGDSGYKSLELECKSGAEPRFRAPAIASGADSKFELISYRDPVEKAREYYKKGLKEGDVVEPAGYPKDPNPTVRVVRNGKVVATIEFTETPRYEATYCSGQI
jgi:hypothetical protein